MTGRDQQPPFSKTRSGPRIRTAIEVDVEVAGQTQKVKLLSRDIGTGGMFLRTREPAPLWKRVRLVLKPPGREALEVCGEVVRSVSAEAASKSKYPPGMAIAFDEASRTKRKQLVELVLELCAQQQTGAKPAPAESSGKPQPGDANPAAPGATSNTAAAGNGVLDEIDSLLEDIDQEGDLQSQDESTEIQLDIELPNDEADEAEPGGTPADEQASQALRAALERYCQSCGTETHYHALGVPLDASQEQIAAAYQQLTASLTPPGTATIDEQLQQQLQDTLGRIRKAYAILGKPDRKKAYDFLIDNLPGEL